MNATEETCWEGAVVAAPGSVPPKRIVRFAPEVSPARPATVATSSWSMTFRAGCEVRSSQVKLLTPIIHTRKQVSKFKETQRKTQK